MSTKKNRSTPIVTTRPTEKIRMSLSRFLAKPYVRRTIRVSRALGLTALLLSGGQQFLAHIAPSSLDHVLNPAAEAVGLHRTYYVMAQEPKEAAPQQGRLDQREAFYYALHVTSLSSAGQVYGRFRGVASEAGGMDDPRWWTVRGMSDGKRALLTYVNESGKVMGHLTLTISKDEAAWSGTLAGIDRSISDNGFVNSPIVVAHSRYDLKRLTDDPHLRTPSTLNMFAERR